ncbi:hypothetical protein EX30DRAFT_356515 [Ascodesmis nigricans]|uniref:DNA/RNA-binding domain-containing protein n=1 Tax=Ascodesmis nigricans TaxID=341454 RepID=A0A4S2MJ00_9PEZI|nr:hypothetical protein EX30DRAFT_356515 [Ascodesmis nigricans]
MLIREHITRNVDQGQLVAEIKGIYAGLMLVESKCVDVDLLQHEIALDPERNTAPLDKKQWKALIFLHRTLLNEFHDFFLAAQHPQSTDALKKLGTKYAMPARMWRHGIHTFLELLRYRLPESQEFLYFWISVSYGMLTLMYETVPKYRDTWTECLGDLARYRVGVETEDDDIRDQWRETGRAWYIRGTDTCPYLGRMYHHLALCARPNMLIQLFYYCKALNHLRLVWLWSRQSPASAAL